MLPVEHMPSTTPHHRTLFWATLVIPDQLVPCCFSSASVSRLQLLRGRPLFLFPCGFQVRAWRVVLYAGFLRVCPIQPHFLHSICLATGSCPARSHRSSFRIFSCHWILTDKQTYAKLFLLRILSCLFQKTVSDCNLSVTLFPFFYIALGLNNQSQCSWLMDLVFLAFKSVQVGVFTSGIHTPEPANVLFNGVLTKLVAEDKGHSIIQQVSWCFLEGADGHHHTLYVWCDTVNCREGPCLAWTDAFHWSK